MKPFVPITTVLAISMLIATVGAMPIHAQPHASLVVDATFDEIDANPGDGQCVSTPSAKCTLRAAIQETNAFAGPDTITLPPGVYTLTINGSIYQGAAAGDLDITEDLTITGAGVRKTIIDGNGANRIFVVFNHHFPDIPTHADISNLMLRNGYAHDGYGGGGILNLGGPTSLTNIIVAHSTTVEGPGGNYGGGGINNGGLMFLADVIVNANAAPQPTGGGIVNEGGGIANIACTPDCGLTLSRVTVSNNTGSPGISNRGLLTVTNSTISHNAAGGIGNGCCVAHLSLRNVTISDNVGFGITGGDPASLQHVLLANNSNQNCSATNFGSLGYNLSSDDTCTPYLNQRGDLNKKKVLLGPLQKNGGVSRTQALALGSPAIDAGDPNGCKDVSGNTLTSDQRGGVRPIDGDTISDSRCDIGAFEFAALKPRAPKLLSPSDGASVYGDKVLLVWQATTDAIFYKVFVKQDSPWGQTVDENRHLTATQYEATLPTPGHSYFWRVSACNSFGCSSGVSRRLVRTP